MSATMRLATQQIRRGPRRVVAIVLAALLSAMAIMATGTFITTMQQGLNVAVAAPYTNADVVIPSGDSEGVVDAVAEVPGIAAIEPSHTMYAQAQAGDRIHNINISSIADDGDLRWMTLTGGQWPVGTGEIAATQDDLDRFGIALGDSIEIFDGTGQSAKVRVVGLVETVGGTVAASTELYAAQDYFSVDDGSSSALVVRLPRARARRMRLPRSTSGSSRSTVPRTRPRRSRSTSTRPTSSTGSPAARTRSP